MLTKTELTKGKRKKDAARAVRPALGERARKRANVRLSGRVLGGAGCEERKKRLNHLFSDLEKAARWNRNNAR